ncbi:hypothetical protein SDJN03_14651, partial [Cucurbita argyrosperma subsp. sororia]
MAGNNRQKKPGFSFSICSLFKSKNGRKRDCFNATDATLDEDLSVNKLWPSDEDKRHNWVAVSGIDQKAEKFIRKIHQSRVLEAEH